MMKRRAGLWVATAGLFSAAALAQDLSASAVAERACENHGDNAMQNCAAGIAGIYEQMNRAFVSAHRVAPQETNAAEQRRWLAGLLQSCGRQFCVQDALAHRIFELRAIEMRSFDVTDQPMTDAEARDVCANVAALDSHGTIGELLLPTDQLMTSRYEAVTDGEVDAENHGQLEQQFTLELRKGRPRSFGAYMGRGTCVSFTIESTRKPDPLEDLKWPLTSVATAEDDLHLIGWGGREYVLARRGRRFIATHQLHGIAYLEWLTPAGTRRGLCTFEDDGFDRIVTARLDQHADCAGLARTPGQEVAVPMRIDLDNDGHLDSIAIDGDDSGAGCGHSWRNIRLLDAQGNAEVSARNDALAKLIGLEGGPVMLLTSKSRQYVYAANRDGVPTVYSVTKTGVVPQCEFRVQYKRRVKTQFSFTRREPDEQ